MSAPLEVLRPLPSILTVDISNDLLDVPTWIRTNPPPSPRSRLLGKRRHHQAFPPRPRLVGIEPNPGPPKRPVKAKSKPPRKRASRSAPPRSSGGRSSAVPKLDSYLCTLRDPWKFGPVRLGWGSFSATSLRTAYSRSVINLGAATNLIVDFMPLYYAAAADNLIYDGWLRAFTNSNGNTLVNLSTSVLNQGADNTAYLASVVQTNRVVSAAIRMTVRYPATSVRGILAGVQIPEDTVANFATRSANTLTGLVGARWANASAAGEITTEIQYRPVDSVSFDFASGGITGGTGIHQHLLAVASGWPSSVGVSVEVICIAHYETQGGFDQAADDYDSGDTLAGSGITMDVAGAVASRERPVIESSAALTALETALESITSSGTRHGPNRGRIGVASSFGEGAHSYGPGMMGQAIGLQNTTGGSLIHPNMQPQLTRQDGYVHVPRL